MPRNQQLEDILLAGSEIRAREFKRTMSWESPATKVKVVKWALGAANLQDGGVLAFGLEPDGALYKPTGMLKEHYDSFDQDGVSETVNTHATPHVDLTVNHYSMDNKLFVVIVARQFTDYPVICAKDLNNEKNKPEVIRGRIYFRSRRKPETTEIQTPEEMREVIDLGFYKHLERYLRQRDIENRVSGTPGEQGFDKQRKDLLG